MRSHFDRAGKQLGFIVIDYLKFLRASERYRGQRHYEVGEISGGLKTLAKDLGIPIILLAQLNREVEKRAEKRPELSDLRESGDLEADADVVLLLYREAYYLANEVKTNPEAEDRFRECQFKLEIIVAKQRMGEVGPVTVFCHPGSSAVRDLSGAK
jgi:replicative DNA helicase